jgi:glycosyltransferase involved in cell wall biosynthesis
LKILFFSSQLLFEETRFGGAKRLFLIARELDSRHDMTLICMDGCTEADAFAKTAPAFRNFLALPGAMEKLGSRERLVRLPIDMRGGLERSRASLDRFLGGQTFDAVFLAYPFALSFLDLFVDRGINNIIYQEDDLFPEYMRLRIHQTGNPIRRLARYARYFQTLRYYRRILRRVRRFAGISPEEIMIMKGHLPWLETHQLKYGIDITRHPVLPPQSPLRLGFIGNYRHTPNATALEYLLETIWPALKRDGSGFRLFIAGVGIPDSLRDRHRDDADIAWMENVPDLRDFYREIGIFINPVISGRGMRTKLIEAAAYGRPLISTSLGAEGVSDLEIAGAEGPDDFLRACLSLVKDPERRASMTANNRIRVEKSYGIAAIARELEILLA